MSWGEERREFERRDVALRLLWEGALVLVWDVVEGGREEEQRGRTWLLRGGPGLLRAVGVRGLFWIVLPPWLLDGALRIRGIRRASSFCRRGCRSRGICA